MKDRLDAGQEMQDRWDAACGTGGMLKWWGARQVEFKAGGM